ncbi:MAG: hypothetical protein QXD62_01125 [Candidatus Woesearchaeota archaeon]
MGFNTTFRLFVFFGFSLLFIYLISSSVFAPWCATINPQYLKCEKKEEPCAVNVEIPVFECGNSETCDVCEKKICCVVKDSSEKTYCSVKISLESAEQYTTYEMFPVLCEQINSIYPQYSYIEYVQLADSNPCNTEGLDAKEPGFYECSYPMETQQTPGSGTQIPPEQPQTPPQPQWDPDNQWKFDIVLSGTPKKFENKNPINILYEVFNVTVDVFDPCDMPSDKQEIEKHCLSTSLYTLEGKRDDSKDDVFNRAQINNLFKELRDKDNFNGVWDQIEQKQKNGLTESQQQTYNNFMSVYKVCVDMKCGPQKVEILNSVGINGKVTLERVPDKSQVVYVNKPLQGDNESEFVVVFKVQDDSVSGEAKANIKKGEKEKSITLRLVAGGLFGWLAECFGCE